MVHRSTIWRKKNAIKRAKDGTFVKGTSKYAGSGNLSGKNGSVKKYTEKDITELVELLAKEASSLMANIIKGKTELEINLQSERVLRHKAEVALHVREKAGPWRAFFWFAVGCFVTGFIAWLV